MVSLGRAPCAYVEAALSVGSETEKRPVTLNDPFQQVISCVFVSQNVLLTQRRRQAGSDPSVAQTGERRLVLRLKLSSRLRGGRRRL